MFPDAQAEALADSELLFLENGSAEAGDEEAALERELDAVLGNDDLASLQQVARGSATL